MLRLNDKITQLMAELKAKEVEHGATTARQKLEIDSLKRDNERLETENVRLRRENNGKMLQEINKNIAKLAVSLTNSATTTPTTPSEERT